jgi:hypothetical protein
MKTHYFVVAGYIDNAGDIRLGDDPEVAATVFDGTVYDDTTNDWSVVTKITDTDDNVILDELRARLADKEEKQ